MDLINTCMAVIFHPIDTFEFVIYTKKKRQGYIQAFMLIFLVIASHISSIYITHIPLAKIQAREAHLIVETGKMLIPLLTWVIACYGVTSIMGGETTLNQTLVAAAYSMTPYVIFTIPLALFSNVLSARQTAFYTFLQNGVWVWVFFLYFVGLKMMNDYSLAKSIGIAILAIFGMVLIWAVALLIFALTSQLWSFIKDIQLEIKVLLLD